MSAGTHSLPLLNGVCFHNNARATTHRVAPNSIEKIVCHRLKGDTEQYLLRWRSAHKSKPLLSWHPLAELTSCLVHVQRYVDRVRHDAGRLPGYEASESDSRSASRKRKSPGSEPISSFWWKEAPLSDGKPMSNISSVKSLSPTPADNDAEQDTLFNCYLERRSGWLIAKPICALQSLELPTPHMKEVARTTPITQADHEIRQRFLHMLQESYNVYLENTLDSTTPSLNFRFINRYIFREGIQPLSDDFTTGCQKPCRPNMGDSVGCENAKACTCLEFAAVDEDALLRKGGDDCERYFQLKEANDGIAPMSTPGLSLSKRFPYRKAAAGVPSTMANFYLEQRYPIYECNAKCNCGPTCKSRLVQKGRKVSLTIFKTPDNRGWGIKTNEDLIRGEFIDVYLGEVITNAEGERREARAHQSGKDKASYLLQLDKFNGDTPGLDEHTCHIVDGQYMGNVTRFMNHSCEPNCRQYVVSLNKDDLWVYNVAFFAYRDIFAGEELTFDYLDQDEEEEEEVIRKRQEEALDPNNKDKKPCNCGSAKCRGYLWV